MSIIVVAITINKILDGLNLGYELKYEIELKKDLSERDLINELRVLNGNLKISIHKDMMEESL